MKTPATERSRTVAGRLLGPLLFSAVGACGGGAAPSGHEAGIEGLDASATNDANGAGSEAAASDGRYPGDAPVHGEASTPAPDTGTLSGALAFSVGRVVTAAPTHSPFSPGGDCNGTAVETPGVISAAVILFAETGFPAQNICNSAVGLPDAGANTILHIEVATAQWASYPGTLTDPLVPGTFSNEQTNSDSLCKLRGGGTAFLEIFQWGDYAQAIAVSGTVTLESIAASSVTGRFDVLMGGPFGQTDAAPPTPLSGTFNATACP
jgi:hypothetical protein